MGVGFERSLGMVPQVRGRFTSRRASQMRTTAVLVDLARAGWANHTSVNNWSLCMAGGPYGETSPTNDCTDSDAT